MNKVTALVAASLAAASVASAQDEVSVSATFEWQSDYVFRGVQLADETFMPAIDVAYGDFYFGVWAALPVDSKLGNGTEVDFYLGYGFAVSELVSLDIGATYYVYPSADNAESLGMDPNTLEFYVGLSFDLPMAPSFYVFNDIELDLWTFEGSIGHSFEVSETAGVDVGAHLGYWNVEGGDSQYYGGVGVAYVYSFTDSASLSVGVNWFYSEEDLLGSGRMANGTYYLGGDSDKLTYGISFTAGF